MKPTLMSTLEIPEAKPAGPNGRRRLPVFKNRDVRSPNAEKRTLLLISNDNRFHENLRSLANAAGTLVVRLNGVVGAVPILRAVRPVAILLDLDLPEHAAWEAADALLQEQRCPPVILLTAASDQLDVQGAMRAGSLVDKTKGPGRVLEVVEETLAATSSAQAERNALQRVLIGWFKPLNWPLTLSPAYRHWGINE